MATRGLTIAWLREFRRVVGWDQRRFAAPAHHPVMEHNQRTRNWWAGARNELVPPYGNSIVTPGSRVSLQVVMSASIVRVECSAWLVELAVRAVVFGIIARFGMGVRAGMLGKISPTVGTRAGSENGIFGVRSALSTRNSIDDLQGGILTARRERRSWSFAPNQTHRAKRPASESVASRFENWEIKRCVCFRGCRQFRIR